MAVVCVRAPLRALAGGRGEHQIDGATVLDVLRGFESANRDAAGWILDERGQIRRHINVFVNGERAAEATAVGQGDRVDVIPAITGG
jgi:molybdopterin synthase sulfur carrier subunit